MSAYYILAEKKSQSESSHDADWPKSIAYSYENKSLLFSAGKGHGMSGFELPVSKAFDTKWAPLFIELNALWILDFLKKSNFLSLGDFEEELVRQNITVVKFQA